MYKDDRKILIRFKDKDLEKQFNDIYQEASSIFEEVKNLGQSNSNVNLLVLLFQKFV